MPIVLPAFGVGDTLRVRAVWTSFGGDEIHLTDCPAGVDVGAGRGGEDMPPFELLEDDVVDGDGSVIRGVRATARTYMLPLLVKGDSYATFRTLQQRLIRCFNPLEGDSRLRIQQPDGTSRTLYCRYNGGAEGDALVDPDGRLWYRKWVLKLRAADPWWYGATTETVTFTAPGTRPFLPILPVSLSRSQVLGNATITMAGDVRTSGVWTIHGPSLGSARLRSATLGRSLELDLSGAHELFAGQTVTVDMRPGRQAITGPDGQSWWSARTGTPLMWHLQPGSNDIELSVSGGTTETYAVFSYTPRFFTA